MALSSTFGYARSTADFHWHRVQSPGTPMRMHRPRRRLDAACGPLLPECSTAQQATCGGRVRVMRDGRVSSRTPVAVANLSGTDRPGSPGSRAGYLPSFAAAPR